MAQPHALSDPLYDVEAGNDRVEGLAIYEDDVCASRAHARNVEDAAAIDESLLRSVISEWRSKKAGTPPHFNADRVVLELYGLYRKRLARLDGATRPNEVFQTRLRQELLSQGFTLEDPDEVEPRGGDITQFHRGLSILWTRLSTMKHDGRSLFSAFVVVFLFAFVGMVLFL